MEILFSIILYSKNESFFLHHGMFHSYQEKPQRKLLYLAILYKNPILLKNVYWNGVRFFPNNIDTHASMKNLQDTIYITDCEHRDYHSEINTTQYYSIGKHKVCHKSEEIDLIQK